MSTNNSNDFYDCIIISRYLIRKEPPVETCNLYLRAIESGDYQLPAHHQRLWNRCMRQPWLLGFVDAHLGKYTSGHPIRQRILLVLALLESAPEHATYFLPRKQNVFDLILLAVHLVFAFLKPHLGRLFVSPYERHIA